MKYLDKETINDFELINVIKEGNYEVIDLLLEKYKPLIIKYAQMYSFDEMEDMLQEGRMTLLDALYAFNTDFNKSFTRFFELILKRRFQRLKSQEKTYVIYDSDVFDSMHAAKNYSEYSFGIKDIPFEVLTELEQKVIRSFVNEKKISKELKEEYGERTVHNAPYRARKKLLKKLT